MLNVSVTNDYGRIILIDKGEGVAPGCVVVMAADIPDLIAALQAVIQPKLPYNPLFEEEYEDNN